MEEFGLVLEYETKNNEDVVIVYNYSHDEVVICNKSTETFKRISDLKNCPDEIWEYIASNFYKFLWVDNDMIKLNQEQIPYLEKEYEYGKEMVRQLLEYYDIQFTN